MEQPKEKNDRGKQDIAEAFWGKGIPGPAQEREALKTAKAATDCLREPSEAQEEALRLRLKAVPLASYFVKLNDRFRSLLSEGILSRPKVAALAERLVGGICGREGVKFGILLLADDESEAARQALQKLGKDEDLTLYVIEASKHLRKRESFLFELAKGLGGYAKMAVTSVMRPLTDDMKRWMLLEGSKNSVLPEMAAIICLENADMGPYLRSLPMTGEVFRAFSRLFSNAFRESKITDFASAMPLVTEYAEAAPKLAGTFLDYSALQTIFKALSAETADNLKPGETKNGWTLFSEQSVLSKCRKAMNHKKWNGIVLSEMRQPAFASRPIIDAVRASGLEPDFEDFLPMLWRKPCDFAVIDYLVGEHYRTYTQDTLSYMKANLPNRVFCGARDPAEDEIGPDFEPDLALCLLLKVLCMEGVPDLPFFLHCLDCRLPDCRKTAVRGLRQSRALWGPDVVPTLEKACACDPSKQVKKSILRLLGRKDEKAPKEQRYVDLPDPPVEPDEEDSLLLTTRIAGAYYRDLTAVDGILDEGDLLFLVREPDNAYDTNAILVATDDGYVLGYIPRAENRFPASLMDSGRVLYAFLTDIDLAKSQLWIDLYMSQKTNLDPAGRPILRLLEKRPEKT